MASYLPLVVIVVLLSIFERSAFAEVSFKNVSIYNGFLEDKIVFIQSSTSLKNNLPSDPFDDVYITGTIPVLYENSVSDINSIKEMHFYDNKIEEIRQGAFRNLSKVTTMEIFSTNLTTLQKYVFYNLSVEDLSITYSPITTIEVGAFQKLPKLRSLKLIGNKLETIDENVLKDLVNLEELDLSKNLIAVIPKIFEKLPHLKNLDLSSNLIEAIPKNIFQKMPHLKTLYLSNNKLEEIQEAAFANSSIEKLYLSWNLLSSLPKKCFKNMPHLSRLDLSRNNLENIREGIFNNLTLTVLHLDFNHISVIAPKAFDDMPNLEDIYLGGNKITRYNPDWFHNSRNIYRLFLHQNLIAEIPNDAFRNIYNNKHQWINLKGNKLKTIHPNAFKGLTKFDILINLAENELETWNENLLPDVDAIYHLDLSSNKIKCVDGDFDKIFKANSTRLRGNPLDPQCEKRIISWASKNQKQVLTH